MPIDEFRLTNEFCEHILKVAHLPVVEGVPEGVSFYEAPFAILQQECDDIARVLFSNCDPGQDKMQ